MRQRDRCRGEPLTLLLLAARQTASIGVVAEGERDPGEASDDPGELIIACADEASAREEAARQQLSETHGAEWIYLRVKGQWVAKRYVERVGGPEKKGWKERLGEFGSALLDPTSWI
jgi:hypothetical protein